MRCLYPLLVVLVAFTLKASASPDSSGLRVERLPDGMRFALLGERLARPCPTLFVFQGDIDVALKEPLYTEVGRIMARHGFLTVVLDAPAHGEDHHPGEPAELAAWRWRLVHRQDLVGDFTRRARAVLEHLIAAGYTDPARVAAVGTSRGGYLAFQFAADEPRIRCAGGISPVTDLGALREFDGLALNPSVQALALSHRAPQLAGRPVWICIGNRDERVGTEAAIAFSRALVAATPAGQSAPVTLLVHDVAGHHSTLEDHERLAAWLLSQPALRP
ncbi:MAG: prolyl oligopeptidase family serine peptidase [Verrucomicrobia bacterium]|nr:prolyl oligopeptidase family serine peptidase [Verrucomicrobiota bacterium]